MKNKDNAVKVIVIALNIILCILFLISLLPAIYSVMLFDAPGSEGHFFTVLLAISLQAAPLVILSSLVCSFIFLISHKAYRRALVFSLLPLINVIAFGIAAWGITVIQHSKL